MQSIRPIVFFVPITILILSVIWSLIDVATFFAYASALNTQILDNFGPLFAYAVFGFFVTCIWIYFAHWSH